MGYNRVFDVSPYFWPVVRIQPMEFTGDVTDYEFLSSVVAKLTELINSNNSLAEPYNRLIEDVAKLQAEIDAVQNGDYEWLRQMIEKAIKNVFFGLTQDGRFVAYVPQGWSEVEFRTTGYDIELPCAPEYGHLVLRC